MRLYHHLVPPQHRHPQRQRHRHHYRQGKWPLHPYPIRKNQLPIPWHPTSLLMPWMWNLSSSGRDVVIWTRMIWRSCESAFSAIRTYTGRFADVLGIRVYWRVCLQDEQRRRPSRHTPHIAATLPRSTLDFSIAYVRHTSCCVTSSTITTALYPPSRASSSDNQMQCIVVCPLPTLDIFPLQETLQILQSLYSSRCNLSSKLLHKVVILIISAAFNCKSVLIVGVNSRCWQAGQVVC